ncbi:MAG: hypothetical protein IPM75_07685 [Candidatus Competibacteraceae bacterium]|nr:hypothetical protein [Candidatus Competibacteraceae bacterium]
MRIDKWSIRRVFITLLFPLVLWSGLWAPPVRAADPLENAPLASNAPAAVPPVLQPWIGWVLQDRPDQGCPVNYDALDQHQCVWPSLLKLDLDARW